MICLGSTIARREEGKMKSDKTQALQFRGVLWFMAILAIVVANLSYVLDNEVSAHGSGPQVNLTPLVTPEPTAKAISPQSTGELTAASASIVATIPISTSPNGIILNSHTGKAYAVNSGSSNVSILDISSDRLMRNIYAGQRLYWGIALKPDTERIFVSDNAQGKILEIDEDSNSVVDEIPMGNVLPEGIAINAKLNKAYVAHSGNLLSVINLSTNQITKNIDTGFYNHMVAVNEVTDRVYVTRSYYYDLLTVIDGNSDTYLQSVPVGTNSWGVAVNSKTNLIYVANSASNTVSVIDGATNTVTRTIAVQSRPLGIAVNEEANRIYVANSDSDSVSIIDGNTNQVVQTVSNVGSHPAGVATNPKSAKVYVTNETGNSVTVILDSDAVPPPSTLTPIILVPGYYASYNAHRMLPPNSYADKWQWWPGLACAPSSIPELCSIKFGTAEDFYQPLINALEVADYNSDPNSPNQNLFIAYYNWLRPNAESAVNDLAPVITQALAKTGATRVHIITHSNGGLVTRSWIQSQAGPTVVDELIMLAPPNYGVARVYPAWAGGDVHRESWEVRTFVFGLLKLCYNFPSNCTDTCNYQFMHQLVPSAQDLIPVYDFLIGPDGQLKHYQDMHEINRNGTLETMNQDVASGLISKVGHVTILGGLTHPTDDAYVYEDCPSCTPPLWLDGKVSQDIQDDGDGSVQRFRVQLPGISPVMLQADHTRIVAQAIPQIFSILGLPLPPTPVPTPPPPSTDTLVYTIARDANTESAINDTSASSSISANETDYSVPVHILITDPLGRKLGYQTDGTFINQIPYAFYHGEADEPKIIAIPNPITGIYRTQVIGNSAGTYGIVVTTEGSDSTLNVFSGAISAGQIRTYSIHYPLLVNIYLPIVLKR
jgi:YVTN family beta-propeller protein